MPDRTALMACRCALVALEMLAGCGQEASLVRETPTGGVVSYSVQNDSDILTSAGRRDAMQMIHQKCPKGSRIIKEGAMPKVSETVDRTWRGQMGSTRLWGIQFTCE